MKEKEERGKEEIGTGIALRISNETFVYAMTQRVKRKVANSTNGWRQIGHTESFINEMKKI